MFTKTRSIQRWWFDFVIFRKWYILGIQGFFEKRERDPCDEIQFELKIRRIFLSTIRLGDHDDDDDDEVGDDKMLFGMGFYLGGLHYTLVYV